MILVHKDTGKPVEQGEAVIDFRGEGAIVLTWEEPRNRVGKGRVYVVGGLTGYFPSVFNLEFREEDR